jgi:hypothetical protein
VVDFSRRLIDNGYVHDLFDAGMLRFWRSTMSRDFPESDWKLLRKLHPIALDRFCERVLSELTEVIADEKKKSNHQRFLAAFKLINERNDEIADAFDDMRRSTAIQRLTAIQLLNLLSAEELAGFSDETRQTVEFLLDLNQS